MKNEQFKSVLNSLGSDHSKISAFTYIYKHLKSGNQSFFSGQERLINIFLIFSFSFPILKHHSSSISFINEYDFTEEFVDDVFEIATNDIFVDFSKDEVQKIGKVINQNVLKRIDEIRGIVLDPKLTEEFINWFRKNN